MWHFASAAVYCANLGPDNISCGTPPWWWAEEELLPEADKT